MNEETDTTNNTSFQNEQEEFLYLKSLVSIEESEEFYPDGFDVIRYEVLKKKWSKHLVSGKESKELKEEKRKFVLNLPKEREVEIKLLNETLQELSNTMMGEVEFDDLFLFLLQHRLDQNDFPAIRKMSLERKIEKAVDVYNKKNKSKLSVDEFLAQQIVHYLQ